MVSMGIAANQSGAVRTLDMLRRLGYKTVTTRLVLHCGRKGLSRGLRSVPWLSREPGVLENQKPMEVVNASRQVYRAV